MFSVLVVMAQNDIFDKIAGALKSGKSHEVAAYFDSSVEMKLMDKSAVYSKNQAEMVLKDFFEKNPVHNFNIIHRGTSAKGARYAIGNLETSNGTFRTYLYVKDANGNLTIQQLNIENQ
jgi:Na+-transporting NADH:ubiquinone oxidoreductase subunit NqrC